MSYRQTLSPEAAAAKAGFSTATALPDRGRSAPAVAEGGAARPAPARSAGALLGRRDRADPEGRARHPRDRRARRAAPTPSGAEPEHPPHARTAHQCLARAARPRAGRDLPPGARARPAGPVRLHRHERARHHDRRCSRSIIGSITSGWRSPASSMPTWCSAARASWPWPRACRMRCGRSAACRRSIAATACRRRSAISTRDAQAGSDAALRGSDAPLRRWSRRATTPASRTRTVRSRVRTAT